MVIEDGLSIKTTSLCNRYCKNCAVMSWAAADPEYHTSLDDIKNLIKFSRDSHITWKYILLSGGEPLLWKHIVEGSRLLFQSKITDDLKILTNGMQVTNKAALDRVATILPHVHHFRVSQYNNNQNQIKLLRERFKGQIEVEDRTKHQVQPVKPVPGTLPPFCRCTAFSLVYGGFDFCGPARCYWHRITGKYWNGNKPDIGFNFNDLMDLIERKKHITLGICQYCISNAHVQKKLKQVMA